MASYNTRRCLEDVHLMTKIMCDVIQQLRIAQTSDVLSRINCHNIHSQPLHGLRQLQAKWAQADHGHAGREPVQFE